MPIFRYTFKKIIATPLTWIMLLLTILFLGLSWFLVAKAAANGGHKPIQDWTYSKIMHDFFPTWKYITFSILLAMMIFIFIALKVTQIFRDEIDDGTLLILVSKPVSRTKIWREKLLSLQVVILLYLFLSISITSIILVIPGVGGTNIYAVLFPYLWILFGVGIIFDLIISSVSILLSLIVNSKALVTVMVSMSALFFVFATLIPNFLVKIDQRYYDSSQALAAYNQTKKKITPNDLDWINNFYLKDTKPTKNKITDTMTEIYKEYNKGFDYPNKYDYNFEQETLKDISNGTITPSPAASIEIDLVRYIYHIGNAFRQWKEQSFSQLLTGTKVGGSDSNNEVDYSVMDMIEKLKITFSQNDYDKMTSTLIKVKAMCYLNVFYQLKYLWTSLTVNNLIFSSPIIYFNNADPYLVHFKKEQNPTTGKTEYVVDTNYTKITKIIDLPTLVVTYLLFGIILFGTSWFMFCRKDFA